MAGYAVNVDTDLHTSSVTSVDSAVSRLGGNDKFRTDLVFVDDVLPAQSVAVFFHDRADDHDLVSLRDQIHFFHDFHCVYSGCSAAFLVGSASSVDHVIIFPSFIRIRSPVFAVSDTDSIDMAVNCDDLLVISDIAVLSGPADHISEAVDLNLVKTDLLHLLFDAHYYVLLFAALAGMRDHGAQKCRHLFLVTLSSLFDPPIIKFHPFPPYLIK